MKVIVALSFIISILFTANFGFAQNAEKSETKKDNAAVAAEKKTPTEAPKMKKATKAKKKGLPKRMYAQFELTHGGKPFGTFKARLFYKYAPKTVDNFVNLAEGAKAFTETKTGQKVEPGKPAVRPFFDGVSFHRVIRGFMIQGGDPTGTGRYTPGFEFDDEFHPNLKHNKKGMLSMAHPGVPNKNGSQFFITVAPTPHLDNKHSIFGEVVEGYDVVEKASKVKTDRQDKPVEDLTMKKVTIIREY